MIIYYFLLNLLYFSSFLFFGEKISKIFSIDKNLERISIKYFQYPIISVAFFSFLTSILIQFGFNIKFLSIILNSIFIFTGIFFILKNRKKIKLINIKKFKKYFLIIFIFISYLFITFSPITDADSLAYHAYFPKKILSANLFYFDFYNFHESLIGLLEFFYVIPLYLKSDYTLQFINFLAFLSIASIFLKFSNDNKNYLKNFSLVIFTSPIFFHLIYTAKPQLIFISLGLLNFSLLYKEKKFDNLGIILFSTFLIIINFLGKSNFLLSSAVLSIFLFFKIYKKVTIMDFFKIFLFGLVIVAPNIFAKYIIFENYNIYNLINFIPHHLTGYTNFWNYLVNAQQVNLFPLSIFFPTKLSYISLSFGLWPILLIFLLKKNKSLFFPILLVLLIYIFGLKQNRFYIEPLLWFSLIVLSNVKIKTFSKGFIENLSLIQIIPMMGVIIYSSFYFFFSNFDNDHREKVLKNFAYGYNFNKIINENINPKDNIIINTRSLYYGNNNLIYPEFRKFSKTKVYNDDIKKKFPKFIVLIDENIENYFLKRCKVSLIKSYNLIGKVNRKNLFLNDRQQSKKMSTLKIYKFDNPNDLSCFN